ncbi:uncharacterized protein LOC130630678 [Hydractinia symbiolongicarpus]|uniref:uncharacterized protein LOC130630678 n=1 Tax=Hydractinia symbiolongicarpus TaxID=13093 RepID=UPI002551C19A|nr:uncharacterized protein LOC130630678 [Hydractinia symbiolongicarpus]
MPSCPRIVFLIDQNQSNIDKTKRVLQNIHLSCLRILSYFSHAFHDADVKASVLWGYKFYNSGKSNAGYRRYKQYPFLDYTVGNFNKFEKELYENLLNYEEIQVNKKKLPNGEQLKSTLTDLLTDFQWDRPELFSPAKKTLYNEQKFDLDIMNIVFLFTTCPNKNTQIESTYFNSTYDDANSFIKFLFPGVLYNKFFKQSKLTLCWIDTGFCLQSKVSEESHNILKEGLESVHGCVIPIEHLSMWWLHSENVEKKKSFADFVGVTSLMRGLLPISSKEYNIGTQYTNCTLLLSEATSLSIILCSVTNLKNKKNDIVVQYVKIKDSIKRKDLSPDMLSSKKKPYFYFLQMDNDAHTDELNTIHQSLKLKMAMKIELYASTHSTILQGVMIPCTKRIGTIVIVNNDKMLCEDNDISEDNNVSVEISKVVTQQEYGTSLANISDSWFFYNPNLGFSSPLKNTIRKIHSSGIKHVEENEENSRDIVKFFKEKFAKEKVEKELNAKTKSKIRTRKSNQMKGMSWAHWRLMEYKKKIADKVQKWENITTAVVKENKDEVIKETTTKEIVIPEFSSDEELKTHAVSSYEDLVQKSYISHREIELLIKTVSQHFNGVASTKNTVMTFLKDIVVYSSNDIREKYSNNNKDKLVQEYLLQIHILLEFVAMHQEENEDKAELTKLIASFLRCVSFEENTFFLRNHLKTVILPNFIDRIPNLLRDLYDEMMLEVPNELRGEEEVDSEDGTSPIKPVQLPSSVSYYSSDSSVASSMQSERKPLKRHPSIVGDNSNKKLISVQMKKKSNNKKKKKVKKERKVVENNVSEEKVVRSLFDEGFSLPAVPVTPTYKRRHSESTIRTKVPNTPEGKQINDMMWKKQDRERRHSNIDKKMKPIEESPLKELQSPCKKQRSLFHRSKSFGCHTSPRRFYAIKRHLTMTTNNHDKSESGSDNLWKFHGDEVKSEPKSDVSTTPIERKLKRRNTLLSNFTDDLKSPENKRILNEKKDSGFEALEFVNETTTCPRRGIFCARNSSETSGTNTLSFESTECVTRQHTLKRPLSPDKRLTKRIRLDENDKDEDLLSLDDKTLSCHLNVPNRSLFVSETTSDWLTEIEKEQKANTPKSLTFRDAFLELSRTPASCSKNSPTIVKALEQAITVSPCLSASSLECLENAPILSPVETKQTFRRRRMLAPEYETQ